MFPIETFSHSYGSNFPNSFHPKKKKNFPNSQIIKIIIIVAAAPKTKDPQTAIKVAKTTTAVSCGSTATICRSVPAATNMIIVMVFSNKQRTFNALLYFFSTYLFFSLENKQKLRKRTKKTANEHRDFLLGK